jgi:DNA-directed RNA polymerase subunit K
MGGPYGNIYNRVLQWGIPNHRVLGGDGMDYNRFERARIIGARALQISLGAPVLVPLSKESIDPVKIAMMEFENEKVPITVKRDTNF